MGLREYKSKRNFEKTPEPESGKEIKGEYPIFVIHKHAAQRLHYDFRLEIGGVLKSWAVPKGPSMDPSLKRLAIMVEDHPLDYKDFEGVIPEGNYGAGSVIIWDKGFYSHPSAKNRKESERLILDGLRKGNIKLVLAGEKLRGEFVLVKTGKDEKSWLLIKKKDSYASKAEILKESHSVISNKTIEEVTTPYSPPKLGGESKGWSVESEDIKNAPIKPMPQSIRPMLATLVKKPFDHPDWLFEVKWDGYRAIAEIRDRNVSLYSRNQISLNQKFSPIVESLQKIGFEAVLDGEIVVVDDKGYPDFQMLQDYQKSGIGHLLYYVFDILYFEGHDLTNLPLLRRKELLKKILPSHPKIKFSDHILKDGILFFDAIKKKGLEGIIAKHCLSVYLIGKRSRMWLKIKTRLTQDAIITGFTEPRKGRKYFGSLVLGVYENNELIYIGHSGGGFGAKSLKSIYERLQPLIQQKCPFKKEPETNTPATWVKPELVCEVAYSGWTKEGIMRQPVFLRMRDESNN